MLWAPGRSRFSQCSAICASTFRLFARAIPSPAICYLPRFLACARGSLTLTAMADWSMPWPYHFSRPLPTYTSSQNSIRSPVAHASTHACWVAVRNACCPDAKALSLPSCMSPAYVCSVHTFWHISAMHGQQKKIPAHLSLGIHQLFRMSLEVFVIQVFLPLYPSPLLPLPPPPPPLPYSLPSHTSLSPRPCDGGPRHTRPRSPADARVFVTARGKIRVRGGGGGRRRLFILSARAGGIAFLASVCCHLTQLLVRAHTRE